MSNLIVLLISMAVAFPAGWLLCRAWLTANGEPSGDSISRDKHHALLKAQRSRYRGQVKRVMEVVKMHEAARDQLRAKLTAIDDKTDNQQNQNQDLQTHLEESRRTEATARAELARLQSLADTGQEQIKKLEHELGLLQTERDELVSQAARQEAEISRAECGELREKLATASHRQRELETRLANREIQIEELQQTVESWKHRVAPLARQIQSYREAVQKLQQEQQANSAHTPTQPASDLPTDPLQRIRGIGPALERRLGAHGIRTFAQIASMDPGEMASLADKLAIAPSLPKRDDWIKQARELANNSDLKNAV